MFKSIRDFTDKVIDNGQNSRAFFRKQAQSSNGTVAGIFYDFSMYNGSPSANYYASNPLESAVLNPRLGIQIGQNQSPDQKYIKSMYLTSSSLGTTNLVLLDYLMYYPFIDAETAGETLLDNTITLPRYSDGAGVKVMLVAQSNYIGSGTFTINYTNQDGVSGRISQETRANGWGFPTALLTSSSSTNTNIFGWHLPLAQGDTGVRSVESINCVIPNGGVFALVLVKDLGVVTTRLGNQFAEKDFLIDQGMGMPQILDGAFLGFIGSSSLQLSNQIIYGSIQTVWG